MAQKAAPVKAWGGTPRRPSIPCVCENTPSLPCVCHPAVDALVQLPPEGPADGQPSKADTTPAAGVAASEVPAALVEGPAAASEGGGEQQEIVAEEETELCLVFLVDGSGEGGRAGGLMQQRPGISRPPGLDAQGGGLLARMRQLDLRLSSRVRPRHSRALPVHHSSV